MRVEDPVKKRGGLILGLVLISTENSNFEIASGDWFRIPFFGIYIHFKPANLFVKEIEGGWISEGSALWSEQFLKYLKRFSRRSSNFIKDIMCSYRNYRDGIQDIFLIKMMAVFKTAFFLIIGIN
jgi:hypothetical protein